MNFKKLKSFFCVIATFFCFSSMASGVMLAWDPSPDATNSDPQMTVTGYNVYYGVSSRSYSTMIGTSNTNLIISSNNFAPNTVYYFAVTATNAFAESDFSAELAWTNAPATQPLNITYVGVKVDYGLNLTSLNSTQVLVMAVTNQPGLFYNESLILTNNPVTGGLRPNDGNNYLYFGTIMTYGTNLTSLTTNTFPLFTFTNPPAYFYRSSLVITNNPF